MKTSRIIWYIVIAAVAYYLIYKAYTNYQASGSIFNSTDPLILDNPDSASRLAFTPRSGSLFPRYVTGRECLRTCPTCTWTTNGGCYPPSVSSGVRYS